MSELSQLVLKALLDIRMSLSTGSLKSRQRAICDQVYKRICFEEVYLNQRPSEVNWDTYLEMAFQRWPKFSGDSMYPVPSPDEDFSCEEYFCNSEDKWSGTYGELRIELLDFCITYLTNLQDTSKNE